MTPQEIRENIIVNDKIEYVLEELGCHHIKPHDNNRYITCGFPDGNRPNSISLLTDNLHIEAYTRDITDQYGNSNLFTLASFIRDTYFSDTLKWICGILGLDYYEDSIQDLPMSLQITQLLFEINEGLDEDEENEKLKPISELVLKTYYPYSNKLFLNDGIKKQLKESLK